MFELDNIWINGKPIALLFGEKWSFWDPFSMQFNIETIFGEMASLCKLENVENGQFLDKWQAYSLTFW